MRVHLRLTGPEVSGVESLFETIDRGWPSVRSLGFSLGTHLAIAWVLAMVSFPQPRVQAKSRPPLDPTEIRIGDRLYYVAHIAPRETASNQSRQGIRAPGAVARKRTASEKPANKQATAVAETAPPPPAARAFIPPEFKRDPVAEQTLIQPDSAPNIRPKDPDVPSFRIWSAEVPKLHRQFVAPGQRRNPAEDPQLLAQPSFDLTAPARQINLNPRLTMQPPPAPLDLPPAPENPQLPAGDPLNIVSISDRPALPDNLVKVPQGNVVAESKSGPIAGSGSESGSAPTAGRLAAEPGNGTNGAAGQQQAASGAQSSGAGNQVSSDGVAVAGNVAGSRSASGRDTLGPAGNQSSGEGAALASSKGPSNREGNGGAGPANAGSGNGSSTTSGASTGPRQTVITRPAGGNFDTVIVQSSPLDLFPEGRNLLSGRPVYTVYVAVGTAKDWPLYFCVAGEKPPDSGSASGIVLLNSPPPVKAPYPTRIVRPEVSLPKYEKYVLLHAVVNEAGRFRELRVVNAGSEQTDQMILAAINGWEFRPASRDGVPVAVEVLLAIPAAGL